MGEIEDVTLKKAVVVSLNDLRDSTIPFQTLEEAFGPTSLGILIVKDLPIKYSELRHKLLSYASYLANLPFEELEDLTCPQAHYLSGWSHGKEALKAGVYDMHKGSFYVNCAFYKGQDIGKNPPRQAVHFPEYTAPNVWPAKSSLPHFQKTFEELCTLIIDTAALVARQCDRYAAYHIEEYEHGFLERIVNTSLLTKARLLHYFPQSLKQEVYPGNGSVHTQLSTTNPCSVGDDDSWCATHIDHGCLTGLTSAIYIDESAFPPILPSDHDASSPVPVLPSLSGPPDPSAGLYIHARDATVTKVSIPMDCLGFQTGEALQLITGGRFRAVPHFVRAASSVQGAKVARNTLAVFTQPNLEEVVDKRRGTTFGEFSKEVIERFGNDQL